MASTHRTPTTFSNLDEENFDLVAKVIELINVIGWNDDDTYTFANGDRWRKFDPDGEANVRRHRKD